jgi:uncharacterized membrane protein
MNPPEPRRWLSGDDGSVLPLVIGVVVVVVMLVTVVTDVSVLWLQRRSLQATVDGAALAGAQAVDLPSVYAGGAAGDLRLDPRAARGAVRAYAASVPSSQQLTSFRLTAITLTPTTVTVRAEAVARPPFLSWLTGHGVTVVAQASARTTTG